MSVEAEQAKHLEKVFEAGKQMDAHTGLFAMTIVKNQDDVINDAWEYLDKKWLTHSMYQYGEGEYFEEYIIHLGKPYKLRLYLPVMPKAEYPRIRLAHLGQQTVMAANAKGESSERKASNAVLEYFKNYYTGDLKSINKFFVRQLCDGFEYGIFTEKPDEYPENGTLKQKVISQGMYLILEGESVGGGGAWGVARTDGTIEKMEALETGKPFCGLCFGFGADGSNDNMVAVEYDGDVEGLESYSYPAHKWLVYVLSGKISEDLLGNAWWYINNKLLDELSIKKDNLPTMEAYLVWDNENDKCSVEICIPYVVE